MTTHGVTIPQTAWVPLLFLPDAIGPEVVVLSFVVLALLGAIVGIMLLLFHRRH